MTTSEPNQTERAVRNFGPGTLPASVVRAYCEVKRAACRTAHEVDPRVDERVASWVDQAWAEMAVRTDWPLGLEQGGAGTSLHLMLMEACYALLQERARPEGVVLPPMLELLNRFQSTNDTLPTALTVDLFRRIRRLTETVVAWQQALVDLERRDWDLPHVGRTQGQDALPMRWGQYWGAWAGVAERERWRWARLLERLRVVPLGSTAIGTGQGAPPAYRVRVVAVLREITDLPLAQSQNPPSDHAHQDSWGELAGLAGGMAASLARLARELLAKVSQPDGVLRHPDLQTASTILPAKTNPVLLEYTLGRALEAQGQAHTVLLYVQEGRDQLNPMMPFLWKSLIALCEALQGALEGLLKLLPLLQVDRDLAEERLLKSPALLNALALRVGYDRVRALWGRLRPPDFRSRSALAEALARLTAESREVWEARLSLHALVGSGETP